MHFTPRETKLIERLRKEERLWYRVRWVLLALGVVSIAQSTFWGWVLYSLLRLETLVPVASRDPLDGTQVLVILFLWTKACTWFVFAICFFTKACLKWHGDTNRMLLLKLLDAREAAE